MSTEQKEPIKMKVTIDNSPQIQDLQKQLEKANIELGKREETIQAYMRQDATAERKAAERVNSPAPPTMDTSSPPLESIQPKKPFTVGIDGSDVDPSWVKANSVPELLETVEKLSKVAQNKEEYQKIMSKLTKKMLNGKPISLQFEGSLKDMIKREVPINDFDDDSLKAKKIAYNQRIKNNRQKWRNLSED